MAEPHTDHKCIVFCPDDIIVNDATGDMWRVYGNHLSAGTHQSVVTIMAIGKPFTWVGYTHGTPKHCIVPLALLEAAISTGAIKLMRQVKP